MSLEVHNVPEHRWKVLIFLSTLLEGTLVVCCIVQEILHQRYMYDQSKHSLSVSFSASFHEEGCMETFYCGILKAISIAPAGLLPVLSRSIDFTSSGVLL